VEATVGEEAETVATPSRRALIIGAGSALVLVLALVLVFAPKLLGWVVGGAVAGTATITTAVRRRRKADKQHAANIDAEAQEVDALQDSADAAVQAAEVRADAPPVDTGDEADRQATVDDAASRLT